MCVYTSGCEDEVDTSCNGLGFTRGVGCNDKGFLRLGDLGDLGGLDLADIVSALADCRPGVVFAEGVSVSSGPAPCTSTQVLELRAQ